MSIIGNTALKIDALGGSECVGPELEEALPESRVTRQRVLVALCRNGPLHGVIEMGRLIAGALRTPLHGLFLGPTPIAPSEVPEYVGLSPDALHGLALDVATGDPGEALAAALTTQAAAYVIIPAPPAHVVDDRHGIGELARCALEIATGGVVMLDPNAWPPRLRRILLPLDGTPSTAAAVGPAGELARSLGAELDIVLVGEAHPRPSREPTSHAAEPGAMTPPQYVDQPHHEWAAFREEFLHRFLGAIGHCPADVAKRFFLTAGDPAAEILRIATEIHSDLLVLVWHGTLIEPHAAVFRAVMYGARCPVLVLRS